MQQGNNFKMKILPSVFIIKNLVLFQILWFFGCSYLPYDTKANSYPVIASTYPMKIIVEINYEDGFLSGGLKNGDALWCRKETMVRDIKVLDSKKSEISFYSKDFINDRRKKMQLKKEFWVLSPKGLILVPVEFHENGKWKGYVSDQTTESVK